MKQVCMSLNNSKKPEYHLGATYSSDILLQGGVHTVCGPDPLTLFTKFSMKILTDDTATNVLRITIILCLLGSLWELTCRV